METLSVYIPMDRRQALAHGVSLPDRTHGAALFADISGFTPLTEALVRELGPKRGPEELTRHLNLVFDALISELDRYGGSVINFSGDAITCWFDQDSGLRATACALAMQAAMARFATVTIPSGVSVSLAMKAAVATGAARRYLAGDPEIQIIDALAGAILDHLAAAEHHAEKGEVVLDPAAVAAVGEVVEFAGWRVDAETEQRFGVVARLREQPEPAPWPPLPLDALSEAQVRPWLLPPVYKQLSSGQGEFLAELRPAVALFLRFGGIDYDHDENAEAKLDSFIREVQGILKHYEASALQLTIGDKGSYLYAAFGAPLAHEDDAVRAGSAALELRALTPMLDFITHVQIGISQGRMRTGAYGGTTRRTYGVLGDEVNLAARLMQAAAPGQILMSRVARQATGEAFAWESLPDMRVKGKAEPVTIFSLVGPKARRAIRLQEPEYALPMVGRDAELALIREKMELAVKGHGQIIGISAEAGMGKSRLVAEVIRLANKQQLIGYGGECQSYGTNTSYLVWQNIWRAFFDLDMDALPEEQAHALETQLARIDPALVPRLPLLNAVLNPLAPIPDNDLTRSLDAKVRKSSLEALLVDCLRARVRDAPLFIVLEDGHWIDPLSHDLLEAVGRAIVDLPVLMVLAYRPPDVQHAEGLRVGQLPHFTGIQLADFTTAEAGRLIRLKLEQFFGAQAEAPAALVERITSRAEGNPFYIEELLNLLRDRGISPRDSRSLEQLEFPTSLHSLILSRIDRLTESQKTTLKIASVIGRLFKAAMLYGVYPHVGDWERLKKDLDAISRMDLTPMDTPEPELTYLFKHIVTQEVAYESLPYATRAVLHDQIGQYVERTVGEGLAQSIDLLAYHYDRSENAAKKREYLMKAGEAAQAAYANAAAINYYQRVLPLLPRGEQVPVMRRLGQVLQLTGKWGEAGSLYHQALELAEQLGDRHAWAECQTAIGELLRLQGKYAEASKSLERAQTEFETLGDQGGVAQALKSAGSVSAQQGDYETARALYQKSLAIFRELDDKPNIANVLNNLGVVARFQGNYMLARFLHEEALGIRRQVGNKQYVCTSLNNLGNVANDQGDHAAARVWQEENLALAREIGDRFAIAGALNNLGNVIRALGDYSAARAMYDESLIIFHELGDRWNIAYLLEDLGGLAALEGLPERALRLVGAASNLRVEIGAPLSPVEQVKLEKSLEPARQALSDPSQAAAFGEGRAMSLEQTIDYAMDSRP
jgi:class 3 adenylate cyclase/tetratricopeptide (TPR) repeat protein